MERLLQIMRGGNGMQMNSSLDKQCPLLERNVPNSYNRVWIETPLPMN